MSITNLSDLPGIYIHVPFCEKKCPYCDFFSAHAAEDEMDRYTKKVCELLLRHKKTLPQKADTLYFGGGTPSVLGTDRLLRILDAAAPLIETGSEITAEVNPASSINLDFKILKKHGLNRVSLGVQSFDDKELKSLGRLHSRNDIFKTIDALRLAGIENYSVDLMVGIPYQTKTSLKSSVELAARLKPKHISAYLLKLEEGTEFFKNKESLNLPDNDTQADLYETLCQTVKAQGFNQYEISNFSREGFESRHNLKYWNCTEYLGIGPSAHSFINGKRFYTPRSQASFFGDEVASDGTGGDMHEYIMLRLRLSDGVLRSEFFERFGQDIPEKITRRAKMLESSDFVICDKTGIRLTQKGFLLSNMVIANLFS